ncbi:hypothetical protein BJV40_003620 [Clostridium beijerinckii]|nr:hypothetical protein [Clostridium beijerinckii]
MYVSGIILTEASKNSMPCASNASLTVPNSSGAVVTTNTSSSDAKSSAPASKISLLNFHFIYIDIS